MFQIATSSFSICLHNFSLVSCVRPNQCLYVSPTPTHEKKIASISERVAKSISSCSCFLIVDAENRSILVASQNFNVCEKLDFVSFVFLSNKTLFSHNT